MIDLYQACADIVNQVPKGNVTTYGAVADALGDNIARRAVGVMLNTYGPPIKMPCHRVVYSGGGLGGFAYGLPRKMEMLAAEGVHENNGKIRDFDRIFFDDFESDFPLKRARKEQLELAEKVELADPKKLPNLVLGLDASYKGTRAFAAGILFDRTSRELLEIYNAEARVNFPYVPTYLGYREIPVYRKIIEQVEEKAILMVDGNGILHPHRFGIASHLGVEFDMPSIGVAKSKLCGELEEEPTGHGESQPIVLDGDEIGRAVKTSLRAKPIFVSPGNKITMSGALRVVKETSKLKLPEPTRLAHIEATEMRRSSE